MKPDALEETPIPYQAGVPVPDAALGDELYRQEVLEARGMPMEEKLILGERLFRWACAVTLEGIRLQNPHASDEECQQILRERLKLGKRLGTL